ncbi:hypothetical protein MGG_16128 [Pyricularia oryzae 70-15]|uniref:Uncharacterized protein n=1 Tax=Pyricularia oryzae (strain 70-15 / ATCC MYA-4617 / FGSC 8958) TaxID=242507 RepID=G4MRW9_PYRO7|nr:uncharacterized protein MGG_16128 [Pyricularia oryzae 70-15]EHA56638.1 hypothetical protein MGG_16128 [Pyricularia oryzae 70-15]KAI7930130.1 hypothetical protein M9X92_000905 [Pyricularia oryzae]KAI7930285.1 hypothetical protein M0657_001754 [Pyricularia oryzae]
MSGQIKTPESKNGCPTYAARSNHSKRPQKEIAWVGLTVGRCLCAGRLQILMHPKWLRRLCRRSVDSPQQPTVHYMYLCSLAKPTERFQGT